MESHNEGGAAFNWVCEGQHGQRKKTPASFQKVVNGDSGAKRRVKHQALWHFTSTFRCCYVQCTLCAGKDPNERAIELTREKIFRHLYNGGYLGECPGHCGRTHTNKDRAKGHLSDFQCEGPSRNATRSAPAVRNGTANNAAD